MRTYDVSLSMAEEDQAIATGGSGVSTSTGVAMDKVSRKTRKRMGEMYVMSHDQYERTRAPTMKGAMICSAIRSPWGTTAGHFMSSTRS